MFFSCEDEVSSSSSSYVSIEAQLWGLEFQGYDGYIVADWEIANTSDYNISGWEVHTVITMINDQIEKGLFFRHNVSISAGDSARFNGNIFFHRDAVSIYPVTLTADNDAMKHWEIISIRGLIE
ncbi:MAG: hypothetical protein VYA09_00065 [Candidatus Neomarinimicrobiota bacterium]|nr:hypothetical protein [Candidatus Neomarinimicrobiota bacterium]MEE3196093.1 hypothetical protein [Candidatus Neomarinimicrobiota bacterium]